MPRRRALPRTLRIALAFLAAIAVWLVARGSLHQMIGTAAAAMSPRDVYVAADRRELVVGLDAEPRARASFPLTSVTSNAILLVTLWGWDRHAFGAAGLRRLVIAIAIVIFFQIAATVAGIHTTLAHTLGRWTAERYGMFAFNAWLYLWQGYLVIGGWAIAFITWWTLRPRVS